MARQAVGNWRLASLALTAWVANSACTADGEPRFPKLPDAAVIDAPDLTPDATPDASDPVDAATPTVDALTVDAASAAQ